ncbi:hypothetical protein [Kribbella sp. HUAS MG21]|uniref:Uncharacterized protein n=1 Tax=Kribbella sp. HUAS MG21 TaxID=3160966 RepID=A0AAU7T4U8_9ACTN
MFTFVVGVQVSTAQAVEVPKPKPDWSMQLQGKVDVGACRGHANNPHSITGGIGYDGYQDCVGNYDVQKVCVKLQELDYYGTYYDRTAYRCSAETVAAHSYSGGSVTCAGALEGTFRTYALGYAWPNGVQHTSSGYSAGVRMRIGY